MVQSDFDGTISLLDVTDTLLNRFGKPGWQELEDAWERGEIGSRECMKGQVALLDMDEAELRARSEEHTSELQSPDHLVCRLLLEKKKRNNANDEIQCKDEVVERQARDGSS